MPLMFDWTFERRIMSHIQIDSSGCWEWIGSKTKNGYGQIRIAGKLISAHRYAYEEINGVIPLGLDLDHLCRNRACINPNHLEPVTRSENLKRAVGMGAYQKTKTGCPSGHPYAGANLYLHPSGRRVCKRCSANRQQKIRNLKNGPH